MAKRFIDTNFYKSPFVRGLKGSLKGLYSFIICDCDGAGIWSKDLEAASMYVGFKISEEDFFVFINSGKAIDLKNGKFFFPDFIEHQYPQGLSEKNPAQKNFIFELKKHNLIDENLNIIKGSTETLERPFEGSKVMVKVKVKEEVVVKEKVRENVFLKKQEIEKLQQQFSEIELNFMFDKLSAYKLSSGKKYKSDYGAILSWVVDDMKKKQPQKGRVEQLVDAHAELMKYHEKKYGTDNS